MKNNLFTLISIFFLSNCFGQDTVERRNRLTDSVIERFYTLKSDANVKQGLYKAFFKRKTIIASGNYSQNKKTGIWNFYGPDGVLTEKFDYDKSEFLYEASLKKDSYLRFAFDYKVNINDTITRPLKVGGTYYGFIPYINAFQLPFDTSDTNTDLIDVVVELLITPLGRLAEYKVHLASKFYNYKETYKLDVNLFNEEDKMFVPARLNHKPILSRVFINCYINRRDGLDFFKGL